MTTLEFDSWYRKQHALYTPGDDSFAVRRDWECWQESRRQALTVNPLTNEQVQEIYDALPEYGPDWVMTFARAIEAAHHIGVQE